MDFSKMSDQEVLEKMNEIYGQYTLYWTNIQKNSNTKNQTKGLLR